MSEAKEKLSTAVHYNPPGVGPGGLNYTSGNQAEILARMLQALPLTAVSPDNTRPLEKLKQSLTDNAIVAYLDAWAVVADVIGFYQERIANEGFLSTALDRRSVIELTRTIGYEPRPGVAASTTLAFLLKAGPDQSQTVTIPEGTGVRSVPGPGEKLATFETSRAITARAEWNSMRPIPGPNVYATRLSTNITELRVAPRTADLKAGDVLLVTDENAATGAIADWFIFIAARIESAASQFLVTGTVPASSAASKSFKNPRAYRFGTTARIFGYNASAWNQTSDAVRRTLGFRGGVYSCEPNTTAPAWTHYPSQCPGLPLADASSLSIDKSGQLFVGTSRGIYCYSEITKTWVEKNKGLADRNVLCLYADSDILYAGTGAGLYQSVNGGASWSDISAGPVKTTLTHSAAQHTYSSSVTPTSLPRCPVLSVLVSGSNLYAGTAQGLYSSVLTVISWAPVALGGTAVQALAAFSSSIYAGTSAGLFSPADWTKPVAGAPSAVTSLAAQSSTIYVGTESGLYNSTDGKTWNPQKLGGGNKPVQALVASGSSAFAAAGGELYSSSAWATAIATRVPATVTALSISGTGTKVYAATDYEGFSKKDWPGIKFAGNETSLRLNAVYKNVVPGGRLLMRNRANTTWQPHEVGSVDSRKTDGFHMSASSTEVHLVDGESLKALKGESIRDIYVHGASAPLSLFVEPAPVRGKAITIAQLQEAPPAGRALVVRGKRTRIGLPDTNRLFKLSRQSASDGYLSGKDVRALVADEKGTQYAATNLGVYSSRNSWAAPVGVPGMSVHTVWVNGEIIYAGTNDGLYSSAHKWGPLGLKNKTVYVVMVTYGGTVYAGTGDGLYVGFKSNPIKWTSPILAGLTVRALLSTNDGVVFAGTGRGLYYSQDGWQAPRLSGLHVNALALSPDGQTIYAGTTGGLYYSHVADPERKWYSHSRGLKYYNVRSLFVGNTYIHVGTRGGGVWRGFVPGLGGTPNWKQLSTGLANDISGIIKVGGKYWAAARSSSVLTNANENQCMLASGETPIVLQSPPSMEAPMSGEWELENLYGFQGTLTTNNGETLTWLPAEKDDPALSETVTCAGTRNTGEETVLNFQPALRNIYDRRTVTVSANTAPASQGATVTNEPLGSGDPGKANQTFALRRSPLTYISSPTAQGEESTLRLHVNGVLWKRVPFLHDALPTDRVYTVSQDERGVTHVSFGDGTRGARLPKGLENVHATYRVGGGPGGNLPAGTMSMFVQRPTGVQTVNNALPATGGTAARTNADARRDAARNIRYLDRIVSLDDYESFALNFAGIERAQLTALWTGTGRLLYLTLAGPNGAKIESDSELFLNLMDAVRTHRAAPLAIEAGSYIQSRFNIQAAIRYDPAHKLSAVKGAVKKSLRKAYSFQNRKFAEDVHASDVLTTIQSVPGVLGADLKLLYPSGQLPTFQDTITARAAVWKGKRARSAEMQLLNSLPEGIVLEDLSS